jgi:spermidine/putrescine transport system permease protein
MRIKLPLLIPLAAIFTLVLLYVPLLAVAVFSVNASRYGLSWKGFTLDWYLRLFQNQAILEAAWNTLLLALLSTLISTLLGTLLAIAMSRFPWPRRTQSALDLLVYLPVVTPDIIFAAALVVAFGLLQPLSSHFQPGLLNMVLAHVTFQIAFVALVVQSRLATMGRVLEEAARDLYASNWYLFRRVTLPLLMPAIAAGAMLAFTLSLDDFTISFFTAGPRSVTLPIHIYGEVGQRRDLNPQIHALATLMLLATVLLVLALERLTRKGTH